MLVSYPIFDAQDKDEMMEMVKYLFYSLMSFVFNYQTSMKIELFGAELRYDSICQKKVQATLALELNNWTNLLITNWNHDLLLRRSLDVKMEVKAENIPMADQI